MFLCVLSYKISIHVSKYTVHAKKLLTYVSFQTKISIIIKNNNSVCLFVCLFEIEGGINLVSKRLNGLKYQI